MKRILLTLFGLSLVGCAPDITETDFFSRHPDAPVGDESVEVTSVQDGALELRVTAPRPLQWGHNLISLEAFAGGDPAGAEATVTPYFLVEGDRIPVPFDPVTLRSGDEPAVLYLLEPVELDGRWVLDVVWQSAGSSGTRTVDVTVRPGLWVGTVPGTGEYLTWVRPTEPRTGQDVLELALHRFIEGRFQPVEGVPFDLYPYMDMGGGEGHSTPYAPPGSVGNGRYRGEINFIMSGGWDLTVYVGANRTAVLFEGFEVR
ncbi:MAG: FixH family protein [Rhodothermales bacterium]|nr:FixH family protein [Rhodothermales bacterium]MBO6780337.1 FixH family protein [Rhodothermales bacterium]